MPKYWGKQIFTHGSFPKVDQKQKTERKRREKKRERLNDGNNNGQAIHGARKHAWRKQAAWAKIFVWLWARSLYSVNIIIIIMNNNN